MGDIIGLIVNEILATALFLIFILLLPASLLLWLIIIGFETLEDTYFYSLTHKMLNWIA